MKITDIQAIYPNYRHPLADWRVHLWQIIVRVETDVGLIGLGYGGGGKAAVEVVNGHFRDVVQGRPVNNVADITALWDTVYRASIPYGRRGVAIMALSGLDLALWGLVAKAEKVPVYHLIDPKPPIPTPAYATGADPEWYAELGFTAHKFSHRWTGHPADYDRAVETAAQARHTFGPQASIMVDCYMSWDVTVTQEMARRLADYNITWFEDVLTPDQLAEQAALRPIIKPIQLAGGEHEFGAFGFAEIARATALDLWQPDITWCGGLTAGLRILELAQQAGVQVVLHRGGEVWGLHLIAATATDESAMLPLAEILPGRRGQPQDILWFDEPSVVNGRIKPSDAPGFGVTLNEELL